MLHLPKQIDRFTDRISYRQARWTVLIAILLGFFFSAHQFYLDYYEQETILNTTVKQVINIVEQSASQAAYSLDKEFAIEVISGLFEYKPIFEAAIIDDLGKTLAVIQGSKELGPLRPLTDRIFGKTREYDILLKILPPPVSFSEMGKIIEVGHLHVKVDTYPLGVAFLERSVVLFLSGMVRNLILSFILLIFFHYFLTKPFQNLEKTLRNIDPDRPERIRLEVPRGHTKDEFARVVHATNDLLVTIQQNIKDRIHRIVERERMQTEITERRRRQTELEAVKEQLEKTNLELSSTVEDLKSTQSKLINSEKMAALGELTASLSHELNTPLGLGVSGASSMHEELENMKKEFESAQISKEVFEDFLSVGLDITNMITTNLRRAHKLIKSFKQVAVDQASETKRVFKIKEYTDQVLLSMGHIISKSGHNVTIDCDEELKLDGFPGAYSQLINNLVMNSIKHAFEPDQFGNISLKFKELEDHIEFIYSDDGKGVEKEYIDRIFEPYFTTKQGKGGSGLGMQVVQDIVTKQYLGTIDFTSELGKGITCTMVLQKSLPSTGNEINF